MHHLKRGLATLAATSLAAAGLAAVSTAPAQAAEPQPVLTWEISQRFDDHLSNHALTDGATESESGVISFPGGVGSYDPATGAMSVAYDGSVAGSFPHPFTGAFQYTITIADPIVTIDDAGDGEISALVSSWNIGGMGSEEASTPPTRVVVTTFDGGTATWTDGVDGLDSVTTTPRWAGVLPPNTEQSAALGMATDRPVDGKSFAPSFLGALTPGTRAHFYASSTTSPQDVKAPATLTAQVAPEVASPAVEVTTTAASYADGLDLSVAGQHFTGETNPGDDGVYLGLAESGELPDTSSMENMALFAAVGWVPASAIVDGSFVTALNAPTAKLDPSLDYSVYTWQAHGHSNTSQDTETPVTIDWSALQKPPRKAATISTSWVKKPTRTAAGKLTVSVKGAYAKPTGKVVVKLVKNGAAKRTITRALKQGAVTVPLPRLTVGPWKVQVRYAGSATYLAATKVLSLRVRR